MSSARPSCWNWRAERLTPIDSLVPNVLRPLPGLAAGLLEDEATDRQDGAVVLGQLDELVRQEHPVVRVVPSHERLGAEDAPVGERDERLVVAPRSRRARSRGAARCRGRAGPPSVRPCDRRRTWRTWPPRPGPWPGTSPRLRRAAGRHATCRTRLSAMPMLIVATISWPALRTIGSRSASSTTRATSPASSGEHDALEQDRRTRPRRSATACPRAARPAQPVADHPQQLVADLVAQVVVHHLEAVDVAEQHRHLAAVAIRLRAARGRGGRGGGAGSPGR